MPRLYGDADRSLRIFLIDDHALFREGLRDALEEVGGLEIVGEAETGDDCVPQILGSRADVAIIDLGVAEAKDIETCRAVSSATNSGCILMSSYALSDEDAARAKAAGASALLLKGTPLNELVATIQGVAMGHHPIEELRVVREYPEVGTKGSRT